MAESEHRPERSHRRTIAPGHGKWRKRAPLSRMDASGATTLVVVVLPDTSDSLLRAATFKHLDLLLQTSLDRALSSAAINTFTFDGRPGLTRFDGHPRSGDTARKGCPSWRPWETADEREDRSPTSIRPRWSSGVERRDGACEHTIAASGREPAVRSLGDTRVAPLVQESSS